MKFRGIAPLASLAFTASIASSASAAIVLSFGYTDLSGQYVGDAQGGNFSSRAVDTAALHTNGDVSRLINPTGTTTFEPGFVSGANPANALFSISVFNRSAGMASGLGTFALTDADGDTITGDISGTWFQGALGRTFFNGDLSSVVLHDNGTPDAAFNGTSGLGLFNMGGMGTNLEGAIVQLFIQTGVGFFDQPFADTPTQVSGEITPAPGGLALLGLGGWALTRRRRTPNS
jgi:MYXO-CTERM domain-containing protein